MDKYAAKEIGARVREIRKNKRLSQQAFGQKVGVSLPTVTRVEAGQRYPDAEMLLAIRREFGSDLDWLLSGKGLPEPGTAGVLLFSRLSRELVDSSVQDKTVTLHLTDFPSKAVAFRCEEDGYAPRIILDDIVIFIPGNCEAGNLVVVCDSWKNSFVRRQQIQNGAPIYVSADQSAYPPLKSEDVTCLGRVCGIIRKWD